MWVVCRAAGSLVGSSDFLEFARQGHSNGKTASPTNKPLYNNNRNVLIMMMRMIISSSSTIIIIIIWVTAALFSLYAKHLCCSSQGAIII